MTMEQTMSRRLRARGLIGVLAILAGLPAGGAAQQAETLAALIAEARTVNPEIEAARRQAAAAAARVPQAGALPDPMLAVGLMYVPVSTFDFRQDGMTMVSVQVGQRLPAPGARGAREARARQNQKAAERESSEIALGVVTRLKSAYYELLFVDRALDVLARNHELVVAVASVARARFAVGRAPQQDALQAQTEVARLEEHLAGIQAQRVAVVAEINALLDRSAIAPIDPVYPAEVRALALARPGPGAFTAAALDGGLGGDLPSLAELQATAVHSRPMLLAHVHRIEAGREGVRLADRERFPDVEVMLGYGARRDRSDMLTATVSVPLPVFAGRKQRQAVVEAEREVAADESRHHQMVAQIQADVATRYAALVRTREQILLLSEGVIPQARAAIESAAAAYQAGSVEFASLILAQTSLFRNEVELARRMADFGRELAALERATGIELTEVQR
jgi:outer membrane protein, heavy metal efflux system